MCNFLSGSASARSTRCCNVRNAVYISGFSSDAFYLSFFFRSFFTEKTRSKDYAGGEGGGEGGSNANLLGLGVLSELTRLGDENRSKREQRARESNFPPPTNSGVEKVAATSTNIDPFNNETRQL